MLITRTPSHWPGRQNTLANTLDSMVFPNNTHSISGGNPQTNLFTYMTESASRKPL